MHRAACLCAAAAGLAMLALSEGAAVPSAHLTAFIPSTSSFPPLRAQGKLCGLQSRPLQEVRTGAVRLSLSMGRIGSLAGGENQNQGYAVSPSLWVRRGLLRGATHSRRSLP